MSSLVTSASFKYEILGTFAECDLVAVVGKYSQTGIIVDMFRLKDNKIMEHWDSDTNSSAWDTKFEIATKKPTHQLRETIEALYTQALLPYVPEIVDDYFYARHIINNGASPSLATYLETNKIRHQKIYHLIADGNFVFVLAQASINDKPYALYEIYKMPFGENDFDITEYWSTRRAVPTSTASGLPIF